MIPTCCCIHLLIHVYFFADMASSSRQSLRPSNQSFQHQNRQLNPLQPTNNKSVPAILSRKRKLENIEMVSTGYKMIFQIFWLSNYFVIAIISWKCFLIIYNLCYYILVSMVLRKVYHIFALSTFHCSNFHEVPHWKCWHFVLKTTYIHGYKY